MHHRRLRRLRLLPTHSREYEARHQERAFRPAHPPLPYRNPQYGSRRFCSRRQERAAAAPHCRIPSAAWRRRAPGETIVYGRSPPRRAEKCRIPAHNRDPGRSRRQIRNVPSRFPQIRTQDTAKDRKIRAQASAFRIPRNIPAPVQDRS